MSKNWIAGPISITRGKTIAYLSQDVVLQSDKSVIEEAYTAFSHVDVLLKEQMDLESQLETSEDPTDILERYAAVCEQLLHIDQEGMKAEAKRVLMGTWL